MVVLFSSWSQRCPVDHFSTRTEDAKDDADDDALLVGDSHARGLGSRAVTSIFEAYPAPPAGSDGGGILSPSGHRGWAMGRQLRSAALE